MKTDDTAHMGIFASDTRPPFPIFGVGPGDEASDQLHVKANLLNQKDTESSWGEPERVANCIWNAHTDMQLFVQLAYYGYTGMG